VRLHSAGKPLGSRHLELIRGASAIRSLAASVAPSLVLATSSNMGLVTGVACRKLRRRGLGVAMKLTNPIIRPRDRHAIQKAYRTALYRFIFEKYDRVLTLTDAERAYLQSLYPALSNRFVTVRNAYVADRVVPSEQAKGSATGARRLLTLARMMPQKRLDVLIEAFARLKQPNLRLTMLGDGPLRVPLENLARSLGVADRIDMPGFVDNVEPALRAADLFVLSSDYEGLPAAVIEALACNVPVVTTDCFFGAREMLGSSPFCAVAPVGDPVALARAIEESLSRGPAHGLQELAAGYGIAASIAAHLEVLRPLMMQD
jgi:glycosyltransferase involved in cell wall biosynthesis